MWKGLSALIMQEGGNLEPAILLGRVPHGLEVASCHLLLSLLNLILVLAEQCREKTVFFAPLHIPVPS